MKRILILGFLLAGTLSLRADEGMWLLMHLKKMNLEDMQKKGLKLTAEEIYDINKPGLKDAVVSLGGFCTAEVISKDGLLLTNHHCAFDAIQTFSTVENDYLTNGFWAMDRSKELNVPGLFVNFLVRMEDVTEKVLAAGANMSGPARNEAMRRKMEEIRKESTKDTHYSAEVKSFFDGNEYYLFIYETYRDVRLVGAPPSSIGKFGGDTDNWMWPRHTGDFAMLRVYSGPDGKPAAYSDKNIPLKPRHHLPISLKGVNQGDYAMIMGYPGSTDRFLTSFGVKQAIEIEQPARVLIRGTRLEIMKADMDQSDKVRIQYASHYASIANYWKYFIGQTRGLKRLKVYDQKKEEEAAFTQWVNADPKRKQKYGNVLSDIESAYAELDKVILPDVYFNECIFGIEINTLFLKMFPLYGALANTEASKEQIQSVVDGIRPAIRDYFKDHHAPTDAKLMAAMLKLYHENVPAEFHPKELTDIHKKTKGDFSKWVNPYYAKSVFTDETRLEAFLKAPDQKKMKADQGFKLMMAFIDVYRAFAERSSAANNKLADATTLFVDGFRQMMSDKKKFYPNANFTMRLTYGQVLEYYPQDGVHYLHYTTLDGIMEKEDPKNDEFIVPAKLKELWKNKDYGQYGVNGVLPVAFISNNDITGGNSGSPVINANGELIGCAFDGNWEAMSGDIAFEHKLQRTISVDIRYVLFIVDKFAGAKHLVDEMTLVK